MGRGNLDSLDGIPAPVNAGHGVWAVSHRRVWGHVTRVMDDPGRASSGVPHAVTIGV